MNLSPFPSTSYISSPLREKMEENRKKTENMEESRKGKNGELEEDELRCGENKMII